MINYEVLENHDEKPTKESKAFFMKMFADHHRYIAESSAGELFESSKK